jgi:hypothetical protein
MQGKNNKNSHHEMSLWKSELINFNVKRFLQYFASIF